MEYESEDKYGGMDMVWRFDGNLISIRTWTWERTGLDTDQDKVLRREVFYWK